MLRYAIFTLLLLVVSVPLAAQPPRPIGIAYCDVDHLYDTLPSPFYPDEEYTPQGERHWNSERYTRKIQQTAQVIDSMSLPITILWGVENEAVVRDIIVASRGDYVYLHRTLNALDGMDFALLYHGDRFFPHYDRTGRRHLYVEGRLGRDTVGLVLCSDARLVELIVRDLREERPSVKLIVAGRSGDVEAHRLGLSDPLARAARTGRGNIRSRGGWQMRDRLLVDTALQVRHSGVYSRSYLSDYKNSNPIPTYDRRLYKGGYSYAFPVFVYLK